MSFNVFLARQACAQKSKTNLNLIGTYRNYININNMAKVTVRGGLVLAGEGQTANPLEFGGDRKTIGKL